MQIYDQLWNEAVTALEHGHPKTDSHLRDKAADQRRGVSLMFSLPASVQTRIKNFLDQLAAEFPGQYYYQPQELHVTIVTLIPVTEHWQTEAGDLPAFRKILGEVLARHPSFEVEFRGVTAAPNAVMIQGFPRGDTLENIRRDLRQSFVEQGFANRLDRRYANAAAHVTAMRFSQAEADWKRLLTILSKNRQVNFGEMRVDTLQLTWGDWYASANTLQVLETYQLKPTTGA